MSMGVSQLSCNLHNLAYVVRHTPENAVNELVPSLWGDDLYATGITKVLLTLIYEVWDHFQKGILEIRRNTALKKTHEAFLNHITELKESRANKIAWKNWMTPLLKSMYAYLPKMIAILDEALGRDFDTSTESLWRHADSIMRRAAKEQHIGTIERQTHIDIPIAELHETLSCIEGSREIPAKIVKPIEEWIGKIQPKGKSSCIEVREFHKALKEVVRQKVGYDDELKVIDRTARVECFLEQYCDIFKQTDEKQQAFCERLFQEKKITFIEKDEIRSLPLGDPIGNRQLNHKNQHVIFPIEGDATKVVVINNNKSRTGMEEIKKNYETVLLPKHAAVKTCDPHGRFKIVQRLDSNLKDYPWPKEDRMSRNDEKVFRMIISMVNQMLEAKMTPEKLPIDSLKIDEAHQHIATTSLLIQTKFNLNVLEDFIYECARGGDEAPSADDRKWLYAKLMAESHLATHEAAAFYQRFTQAVLEDKPFNANLEVGTLRHQDPKILTRGLLLEHEIKKMVERTTNRLQHEYHYQGPTLEAKVQSFKDKLKELYMETGCLGRIWPSLEHEAFRSVLA